MTGLELKLARVKLDRTQWELALELGISAQRLSEMEHARRSIPEAVAERVRELETTAVGATDA